MARASMALCAALAAAMIVLAMAVSASAQHCDSSIVMVPCSAAIKNGAAPSGPCCSSLKDQFPCFCRSPPYAGYLQNDNFLKALSSCSIPVPECEP